MSDTERLIAALHDEAMQAELAERRRVLAEHHDHQLLYFVTTDQTYRIEHIEGLTIEHRGKAYPATCTSSSIFCDTCGETLIESDEGGLILLTEPSSRFTEFEVTG